MTIVGASEATGAGLGELLVAALRDAANRPEFLTSPIRAASLPTRAVDPIALFAAAAEAGLEAALWLQPGAGTALVGVGRAWAIDAEGPSRFAAAESAFRRLVPQAPQADAAPIHGPILLGGLGFSGRRPPPGDPWGPFGPSSMVVPSLLYAASPGAQLLTGSVMAWTGDAPKTAAAREGADGPVAAQVGAAGEPPEASARALDRRWARLAERAHALDPGPSGIVARPVVARLAVRTSQPALEAWRRIVGMYAGAVGRGRIDKVVLARRVELRSAVELDVPNALRRLALSSPESTVYAFRRDGATFLGATPERLVRTDGRSFRTAALAGTIRRGTDAAEDAALSAELLASAKNREEQRVVVAAIRDLLAPVAQTLDVAPRPSILTLRYAHHLLTEISGTLPPEHGLLSLAALLHPTPAVGGEPRDAALRLIDEHEGFERGWYAGPIGWLGADGNGELSVALRCGVVDRTQATVFAGCGIVADSDPDQEWEESRIKLRAVISALGIPGADL